MGQTNTKGTNRIVVDQDKKVTPLPERMSKANSDPLPQKRIKFSEIAQTLRIIKQSSSSTSSEESVRINLQEVSPSRSRCLESVKSLLQIKDSSHLDSARSRSNTASPVNFTSTTKIAHQDLSQDLMSILNEAEESGDLEKITGAQIIDMDELRA